MPLPMFDSTSIDVVRGQFLAWTEGVHAYLSGLKRTDNPYQARTFRGDAWENGFEVVEAGDNARDFRQDGEPIQRPPAYVDPVAVCRECRRRVRARHQEDGSILVDVCQTCKGVF